MTEIKGKSTTGAAPQRWMATPHLSSDIIISDKKITYSRPLQNVLYVSSAQTDAGTATPKPNYFSSVRDIFDFHAAKWKDETMFASSLSEKYLHPSYGRIIGLGEKALPYIFSSMSEERDDWFYAIRSITGENVVPDSLAGDVEKMTQCWLEWGKKHGYL
ncbi:MAG: hypothetical protein RIM72_06165 [Alphaproteobacteria bacterium]